MDNKQHFKRPSFSIFFNEHFPVEKIFPTVKENTEFEKTEEYKLLKLQIYREFIDTLSFKDKVIEFVNLWGDGTFEKSVVIVKSFTPTELKKFHKYDIIDKVIRDKRDVLEKTWYEIEMHSEYLNRIFSEIFIYEQETKWKNNLLSLLFKKLEHSKDPETISEVIHSIQTHETSFEYIVLKKNQDNLLNVDSSEIKDNIEFSIKAIEILMRRFKSYMFLLRSFLEEMKCPYLFPLWEEMKEVDFEHLSSENPCFSILEKETIENRKTKTSRDTKILSEIEKNIERGYVFPVYDKLETSQEVINNNHYFKEWKKRTSK